MVDLMEFLQNGRYVSNFYHKPSIFFQHHRNGIHAFMQIVDMLECICATNDIRLLTEVVFLHYVRFEEFCDYGYATSGRYF